MINSFLLKKFVTYTPVKQNNYKLEKNKCVFTTNNDKQVSELIKIIRTIAKCFLYFIACKENNCAVNNNGNLRYKLNHAKILANTN